MSANTKITDIDMNDANYPAFCEKLGTVTKNPNEAAALFAESLDLLTSTSPGLRDQFEDLFVDIKRQRRGNPLLNTQNSQAALQAG